MLIRQNDLWKTKYPEPKLAAVAAELRARSDKLTAKRAAAQAEFERAQAAREQFFTAGDLDDDGAAEKLQATVDAARSSIDALDAAITALGKQQAEADRRVADERICIERKAASDALAARVATVESDLKTWLAVSHDLAAKLRALDPPRWDAGRLGDFIDDAAGQQTSPLPFSSPTCKTQSRRSKRAASRSRCRRRRSSRCGRSRRRRSSVSFCSTMRVGTRTARFASRGVTTISICRRNWRVTRFVGVSPARSAIRAGRN